ncbi:MULTISPECIES: hypothetical protein [Streptomyces]|uniref:hypothetical protein n=1 Tax=Streptomyces TaxID=1883 RepID=UPI0012FF2316|nr:MULTISPECIES: hypothetical protein [Streptomyces]
MAVPADKTGSPRQPRTSGPAAHGSEPHTIHAGPMVPGIHAHHVRHLHRRLGHAHHPSHASHQPAHAGHPSHPGPSPHAGHPPAGHSPGGRPDGVLGNRSMADSGSSRHGDAHAVTLSLAAPLTLMPGAGAPALAAGTACGHRDIPLFPG